MRSSVIATLLVLLIAGAGLWYWQRQREMAELQLAIDSTRVLSQAFAAANQLKVAGISGELVARADDPGMIAILASSQTMKAPYTVDYFIDLARVGQRGFSWNADAKRLVIELPDLTIGKPNIDASTASVTQSGLYISRAAGIRMQRKAAQALAGKAGELANSPENLKRARDAAKLAVRQNALAPLHAAGIADVDVDVRFVFERNNSDDLWDYTTPIDQVAERLARMKGAAPANKASATKEVP